MNIPTALSPVVAPVPVQPDSKADKSDRRKLKLGVDSYVHDSEESDTSNTSSQATIYDQEGKAKQLKTSR